MEDVDGRVPLSLDPPASEDEGIKCQRKQEFMRKSWGQWLRTCGAQARADVVSSPSSSCVASSMEVEQVGEGLLMAMLRCQAAILYHCSGANSINNLRQEGNLRPASFNNRGASEPPGRLFCFVKWLLHDYLVHVRADLCIKMDFEIRWF